MKRGGNGTSLFLVELMIDLCLFVVCAAVCVGLLVHARGMSMKSTRLTQAVYIAQDAAERWRAGEEPAQHYSADGVAGGGADYTVSVHGTDECVQIRVCTGAEGLEVYTLTVGRGVQHG